jgi:hypothetical protein
MNVLGGWTRRTSDVPRVDRKERYRRQAALCYEIAAAMTGKRAASMMRLGDTYAALAVDPEKARAGILAPAVKYDDPECPKCRGKMRLTHSLPSTDILPAMQAFRCDACGETLIWKDGIGQPSKRPSGNRISEASHSAAVHYVALSFRRVGRGGFDPGEIVECADADDAIRRAERMAGDEANVGSVAFSRRGDPDRGQFEKAVILMVIGKVPKDFDIA